VIELPPSSRYRQQAGSPVDDQERNDLAARLGDRYAAGELDDDAYRELLDRVFSATSLGELVPVVEALPPRPTHGTPAIAQGVGAGRPGEVTESRNAVPAALYATIGVVGLVLVVAVLLALVLL